MKRWIRVLLCICAPALVFASDPEKETRLKKGDAVFAFVPVSWRVLEHERAAFPADLLHCDSAGCEYVVPACDPLYVSAPQSKDRTHVMPGDERIRKIFLPSSMKEMLRQEVTGGPSMRGANPFGSYSNTYISGGWSSEVERGWSLTRDECLANIKKPKDQATPPEKPPEKSPEESPAKPPRD